MLFGYSQRRVIEPGGDRGQRVGLALHRRISPAGFKPVDPAAFMPGPAGCGPENSRTRDASIGSYYPAVAPRMGVLPCFDQDATFFRFSKGSGTGLKPLNLPLHPMVWHVLLER